MPRVIKVAKARKDQGTCGKCGCELKKGQPYLRWKIRQQYGGILRKRCTGQACYPKRQDLTTSEWVIANADFSEALGSAESAEDLQSVADDIRLFGEEQRDKFDNLPEGLQQGNTGELLEQRADACDECADGLEGEINEFNGEWEDEEPNEDELSEENYNAELEEHKAADASGKEGFPTFDEWKSDKTEEYKEAREDQLQAIKDNFSPPEDRA